MTITSTPEQKALPAKWFQTEQTAVVAPLIIATEIVAASSDDFEEDDIKSLDDNVFSESTNNGRKGKAAANRNNDVVTSDFEEDDIKSLDDYVFSESTNNGGRKRKAAPNRNNKGAGTQDDYMAKLSATLEVLAKTQAYRAKMQAYGDTQTALYTTQSTLIDMQVRRRTLIKEIGGKDALKKLRQSESQDSNCSEIDEMEEYIEILKKRSATLQKAYDAYKKIMLPSAYPSASI
jgi:hypothetical protein